MDARLEALAAEGAGRRLGRWSLLAVLVVLGCAASTVPSRAIDPTAPLAVTRTGLAQAEALAEAGHVDEAADAARRAAEQARQDGVLAALEADDDARKEAQTRWRAAARVARRLAARTRDRDAELAAVLASPRPQRFRGRMRRRADQLSPEFDALEAAHVEFARRGDDGVPWLTTPYSVTAAHARLERFEALPRRWRRDPERIDAALDDAVNARAPRGRLVAIARAMVRQDPWHVPAQLVLALDREVTAGRLAEDPSLWSDVVQGYGAGPLARLDARWRATSLPALRLAWIHVALASDLVGDAAAAMSELRAPGSDVAIANAMAALLALHLGDADRFARWRREHGEPSMWLDDRALSFDTQSFAPRLRALGAEARRRHVDEADEYEALHVASDPGARRSERRIAERRLSAKGRRLARACAPLGEGRDACLGLYGGSWAPDDGRLPGGASRAALLGTVGSSAFGELWTEAPPELDAGPLRGSAWYRSAAIDTALREGDGDRAARWIDGHGPALHVSSLVAAALADPALRDGAASPSARVLPPLGAFGVHGWSMGDGAARGAEVSRAFEAAAEGRHAEAASILAPLAAAVDGRAGAWLSALHALAALRADDEAQLHRALARVDRLAPDAALGHYVRGHVELRGDRPIRARHHFAAALRRDGELAEAFDGLLEATLRSPGVTEAVLRSMVAAAPRPWRRDHATLVRVARRGRWTDPKAFAQVWLLLEREAPDDALALAPIDPEVADRAVGAAWERLVTLDDPRAFDALAAALLVAIPQTRDPEVWAVNAASLHFVLGRPDAARAELTREHALEPTCTVGLLLAARGAMTASVARTLWRAVWVDGEREPDPALDAWLGAADEPAELALACQILVDHGRDAEADGVCGRAQPHFPSSPVLAVQRSVARARHDPARWSELAQALFEGPAPPGFSARPDQPVDGFVELWFTHRALVLQELGRHDDAARAWLEAIALDREPDEEDDDAQLGVRGWTFRAREVSENEGATERSITLAIAAGDLVVARAAALAASTSSEGADPGWRFEVGRAARLVAITESDLARRAIDRRALPSARALLDGEGDLAAAQAFHDAHPTSALAAALRVEACLREARLDDCDGALAQLHGHRRDPLVAVLIARAAIERDDPEAARASVAAADTTGLGGALAQWAELPEGVRGRDAALDGLRDAARLEQRLRAGAARRGTTRVVAMAHGLEVVPPPSWRHEIVDRGVTMTTWNAALELRALPRAARCTGVACAESVLDELRRAGATVLSTRQVTLPLGAATEIVAANRTRTQLRWVVPLGARIFEVRAEVDHDHLAHAGPALLAAVDSVRALDGVLSAFDAESLRTAGAPVPEPVRMRARAAAHVAAGSGCPVTAELARLDDATAAAVLLDLWLATPDAVRRRRLAACAPASSARAARLGLVALLDETPSLHAFGRAVIAAQPEPALRDAGLLLPQHDAALSDPQRMLARELPPRGVLELALALPIDEARRFTRGLVDGDDPGRRAMGWAAVELREGLLDRADIVARIEGPTLDTLRAVRTLERVVEPAELARLRVVFDALSPRTYVERELAEALALRIAEAGSIEDHRRLAAAAARVQDDATADDAVAASRSLLRDIAEAHARRRAGTRKAASNVRVGRLVDEWQRARDDAPIRWRAPDSLRAAALAELLPGDDWVLARVGNPSLVGAAARGLLRRLQGARATDTQFLARIVGMFLDTPAAQLLEPESGLDLTRPIECASRSIPTNGIVCAAHVVDRERVLAALGQREYGDDSGVTAPLALIEGVPVTPLALSVLPAMLQMIDRREDAPKRRVIAIERARARQGAGPFELERYAIARAQEDELRIDVERYLFVGDRMFVFTNQGLVADVLAAPEGPSLADGAEFRRLTAGWGDRAASLTAIAGGTTSPTDAPTTAEITVVRDGVHARIRGEMRGRPTPTRLAAALPEGAASTIVLGPGVWRPKDEAKSLDVAPVERGRLPPVVALLQARDVAFGWYPRPGDALWQRWVAVLDDTPATAKALQAQGIRIGAASSTLHTARRGGAVVLATDVELLAQTLPRIGTASAGAPLLAGSFDGPVAAAAFAGFGALGGLGKEGTRVVGLFVGAVRRAEYDAVLDPATGLVVLSASLQLSAAAEETPEIVDAWLAARDEGNSTRLPRRVAARELGATLSYVFEVDDGRWFADQVLLPSPRTHVTVRDAGHVQVDVRATAEAPAQALDAAQRRQHTAATDSFPSRDPAITSLLGSIVDDAKSATDRAAKINAFVHGRLRYAVTPQHLDGVEVLAAGEGDCSEYATLTVTLLRAASIPAVLVQGMVASGDRMVAHAWVSYHDGQRWREMDPTAGTMGVTSGHLELSVVDALSLHAMGRLLVTSIAPAGRPAGATK